MKRKYNYYSSKIPIIISVVIVYLLIITINCLSINLNRDYFVSIFNINIIVTIGVIFYVFVNLFFLFQATYNGLIYIKQLNNGYLEINNSDRYLNYLLKFDNKETNEIKVNYDDIYLIKRYKCTFVNLYYYEVFYTDRDVIKKIVVSISTVSNLEKKIKKKIKLIKEEDIFCSKLPEPESWIN